MQTIWKVWWRNEHKTIWMRNDDAKSYCINCCRNRLRPNSFSANQSLPKYSNKLQFISVILSVSPIYRRPAHRCRWSTYSILCTRASIQLLNISMFTKWVTRLFACLRQTFCKFLIEIDNLNSKMIHKIGGDNRRRLHDGIWLASAQWW